MDKTQLQQKLNGKSFSLDDSKIIYTFVKDSSTLEISDRIKTSESQYSVRSYNDGDLCLDFDFFDELLKFQILSLYGEPFKFKLWGNVSKKVFGVFTEIKK